jgi:hypothetical protein
MEVHGRNAIVLRLAKAESALRDQWHHRNLYLPRDRITSTLAARKNNARAAIRWYVGEIRSLRLRVPSLVSAVDSRAAALHGAARGAAPGHPLQIWTRAVSTTSSAAPRASWIPLPASRPSRSSDGTR